MNAYTIEVKQRGVKPWTLVYWVIYVALPMSMYGASLSGLEIHELYILRVFSMFNFIYI
jgi:hypothetical protein